MFFTCVTFYILYGIKSGNIEQIASLIIYGMTNYSLSLQLSERHVIGLSKSLNVILIFGIMCQERYSVSRFSLPPGVRGWQRFLLVALPGRFCLPFFICLDMLVQERFTLRLLVSGEKTFGSL